ncbi:MAG: hypothetical protein CFE45_08670 [Burkholderiales bacterium PBB5]|nr:MAG: hypothetical protein CFE45_08670 [Burkholderiales bacterium PBB5]
MVTTEGLFIDWHGNARNTSVPGGGYTCEVDSVAKYVAVMARGRELVQQGLALIGAGLPEDGWATGPYFGMADAALFYNLFRADKAALPMPARCAALYQRMRARPVVQPVLAEGGYRWGRACRLSLRR